MKQKRGVMYVPKLVSNKSEKMIETSLAVDRLVLVINIHKIDWRTFVRINRKNIFKKWET